MVMPREHLIQGNGDARRKMLISSRVMVMPGEHLIQGNGHAQRTSHPG
jgi:hypothetical protein